MRPFTSTVVGAGSSALAAGRAGSSVVAESVRAQKGNAAHIYIRSSRFFISERFWHARLQAARTAECLWGIYIYVAKVEVLHDSDKLYLHEFAATCKFFVLLPTSTKARGCTPTDMAC